MAVAAQINAKQKPLYIKLFDEAPSHYTCGGTVRGVLRVDPTLRPRSISLTFKGFCVLSDLPNNQATPALFTQQKAMFESSGAHESFDILKRGTAADGKVELPFEFVFPYTVDSTPPPERDWQYLNDTPEKPRFQQSPGFPLPPTCSAQVSVQDPIAPKISVTKTATKIVDPRVTYALEASMESVASDTPSMKIRQELKFIPPAPEYDLRLLQPLVELGTNLPKQTSRYKLIRTRKLLPGYGSSSKLGKIRDVLVEKELYFGLHSHTEVPFVKFNVLASPARVQVIGSNLPIILSVQHLERSPTVPDPPEVFMRRLRVQLLPTFHLFVPSVQKSSYRLPEIVETTKDTLTLVDRKFNQGQGHPLHDGLNIAVMEDIQLVHPKLIPSFKSYGLALEYEIQVDVWGECAGHEFSGIACREKVQLVSGWSATAPPGLTLPTESDDRPEYHELDSVARHELGGHGPRRWLPGGDGAPEYDDHYTAPPAQPEPPRPVPPPYMA